MRTYTIGYFVPKSMGGGIGAIKFQSEHKAGSRGNLRDARMELIRRFGNEALQWGLEEKAKMQKG